jgi:hypothetical protein
MLPSDAMPITTVTKITGPVTVLMSWMKGVGEPLRLLGLVGRDEAEDDPGGDRDEDPEPEPGDEAPARLRAFRARLRRWRTSRLLPMKLARRP